MLILTGQISSKYCRWAGAISWYKNNYKYTAIGKLVYELKYGNFSNDERQQKINELATFVSCYVNIIKRYLKASSILLVAMPSYKPLGKFKIPYGIVSKISNDNIVDCSDYVKKTKDFQAKNIRVSETATFEGSFVSSAMPQQDAPILLLDDLFGTGRTAKCVTEAIRRKNNNPIYFLSLTANKYGGAKGASRNNAIIETDGFTNWFKGITNG
jgi:hypothetical protein